MALITLLVIGLILFLVSKLLRSLLSSPTDEEANAFAPKTLRTEIKYHGVNQESPKSKILIPTHKWLIRTASKNKNEIADNKKEGDLDSSESEGDYCHVGGRAKPRRRVRIALLTYGTRGDIEPMIALALSMKKDTERSTTGTLLEPFICAPDMYKKFIEDFGIEFVSCGIDKVEQPKKIFASEKISFADAVDEIEKIYKPLSEGFLNACRGKERENQPTDFIIAQVFAKIFGMHIAEKLKIPCWVAHFAPSDTPTFEFPPPEYEVFKRRWLNKLSYHWRGLQIILAAKKCGLIESDEHFRESVLKLQKLSLDETVEKEKFTPCLHAYSPILQPKPSDWASWHMMTGPWRIPTIHFDKDIAKAKQDQPLMEFLNLRPLFVTFGSMEHVNEILFKTLDAVVKLEFPVMVCAKPELVNEIEKSIILSDSEKENIHFVYNVPFGFIFEKCRCVIHHGGAGTTAAAAYAGVPSVIIPILQWSDQQFWARVISNSEAGIHLPLSQATVKTIEESVLSALELQHTATKLHEILNNQPDGAELATRLVLDYFNTE